MLAILNRLRRKAGADRVAGMAMEGSEVSSPQDELRRHADYGYVHVSEVKRRDERSAKAGRTLNPSLGIIAAIFFILSMGALFTDHIGLGLAFATLCALAAPIN